MLQNSAVLAIAEHLNTNVKRIAFGLLATAAIIGAASGAASAAPKSTPPNCWGKAQSALAKSGTKVEDVSMKGVKAAYIAENCPAV